MQLPPILFWRRRDVDHVPDAPLPCGVAEQHRQELPDVEPIGLRPPPAPIDLDARGIDHQIRDALRGERAVQPEAIAPGFVAAQHSRRGREPEAPLRLSELGRQHRQIARRDRPLARGLAEARGEAQLPVTVAQLEREV